MDSTLSSSIIDLPVPRYTSDASLENVISKRRSQREYGCKNISLSSVSQLLWSAQGLTSSENKTTAPSAGGLRPLQLYVIANLVEAVASGLYGYNQKEHRLELQINGNFAEDVRDAALEDQPWVEQAALIIAVTADIQMMEEHFQEQPPHGQRGSRYVYIETGAVAQNVHLQATALGLGCVLVGGFDDDKVKGILDLPSALEPTALVCLGVVDSGG